MVDFPRAFEIANAAVMEDHHEKCSHRQTNGGVLCDCDVIYQHPEYLDKTNMYTRGGTVADRR